MRFSYSVIGDNTQENREWLEKLGYESLRFFQGKKCLYATTSQRANAKEVWNEPYYCTVDDVDFYVSCGFIPILDNSPLFKAVTAIREDSDYMQLFVIDRINGATEEYVSDFRLSRKDKFDITEVPFYGIVDYHKATLEELIAHFKVEH